MTNHRLVRIGTAENHRIDLISTRGELTHTYHVIGNSKGLICPVDNVMSLMEVAETALTRMEQRRIS